MGKGTSVPSPSIKSSNNDLKGVGYAKNKKTGCLPAVIPPPIHSISP